MGKRKIKSKNFSSGLYIAIGLIIAVTAYIALYNSPLNGNNLSRDENLSVSDSDYPFGIDISHYQGVISWPDVRMSDHPIDYIFIRASMGTNGKDQSFAYNWFMAKEQGYIRGAYHYYRPNENSTEQFRNFAGVVKLEAGDFPPILDIEKTGRHGTDNLRKGVLNWLKLAEEHYGIKPVIYTGRSFYEEHLRGYVDGYPLWIAAYSEDHQMHTVDWTFHQFTEEVIVHGIREKVDGNFFNGELPQLKEMCLKELPITE